MHQGMVFSERYSIYRKNGAIKYITHLDKFSYFPKHYNFNEIMLYSQYPSENFLKLKFVFSQTSSIGHAWLEFRQDEMCYTEHNFQVDLENFEFNLKFHAERIQDKCR